MAKKPSNRDSDDEQVIFRRYRKDPRTGKVLDAHRYGIKAWPIRVR